eukprot:TRINITY_DN35860_c1_g1_i2.p1 TRINITY_DN35860_c1_g1~~TRINITY_DN35860_c1_g1_i2.p1  ORF type:complete len:168 (-),score=8.72 TRINITY_DN35860_c1_g1_i2:340-843(-)
MWQLIAVQLLKNLDILVRITQRKTEVNKVIQRQIQLQENNLNEIGMKLGKIRMDSTGYATFNIDYECIVFRPYRGEVVDTVVNLVTQMGFFAECGACTVFVSSALIPEDFGFQSTDTPMFLSGDEEVRIQQGSEVRLRIIGIKAESHEMFCIGTIKDDYLGVIGNPV